MRLTDLDRMLLEVIDGLIPTVYDERGHAIYEAARLDPRLAEAMLCPGESDLQDFTAQERADMSEWIVDSSYEMRTQVETASEYAEPGYSNPESPAGIAFANWNGELEKEVGDILEWLGWELEWSDSWVTCYSCGRAVRSQPDSYAWTAHYYVSDECEKVCFDCVIEYGTQADAYIKGLCGNPGRALTADLDLTGFGFLKVDARWESGYRGGQNDDPREIALKFVELITDQYIFELDSVGQFDCKFSLWVDKEHHTAVQEAISFRNL